MSFDWQTEEDGDWEEQTWKDKPVTAESPKPPWRTLILAAVLLVAVGVVVYRQVNRRIENATTAVESDIFAAHNVLSRAAEGQDADLGKAVLSGRDMGWSQTQSSLLEEGLFYEHPGLGLQLPEGEAAFAPLFREDERFINLVVDPDLNGAQLLYARDYLALTDEGLETVTLQQTAVYRRGDTRWLFAPPLEDFWGEWQTEELDHLTFVYPQRDEAVVQELIPELQSLLEETCDTLPELSCTTPMRIRFDTDPESLLETADPTHLYDENLRLDLPTPTLVGLPINNDGYEALRTGYGRILVAALFGYSLGYECCQHAPVYQAVVTYQLSQLGLAEWPVTHETYTQLAEDGVHTDLLFPFWGSQDFADTNGENSQYLLSFIDFLVQRNVPPTTLIQSMERTQSFSSWLRNVGEAFLSPPFNSNPVEELSRDWWFFALTQSEMLDNTEQPVPLPAQDLQVMCMNEFTQSMEMQRAQLFRYGLGSETWVDEFDLQGMAFFNPLPHDNGVILQLVQPSEDQYWETLWWHNGAGIEVKTAEDAFSISLGQMDPNGRFLLTYTGIDEEVLPASQLVDVDGCQEGSCDSTAIEGTPYWSPNGQLLLLTETHLFESQHYMVDGRFITLNPGNMNPDGTLWLRPALAAEPESAVPVGEGSSPFWIGNEEFGYIRTTPSFAQELVTASIDNVEPQVVLTTQALAEALVEQTGYPLLMQYATAHPTDPHILLVMAAAQNREGYLFQVERQTGDVTLLFPLDVSRGEHSLGFSPDGRFLIASGSWWQDENRRIDTLPFGVLHLYDLETGDHRTILINNQIYFPAFTFDWSLDGTWLAFIRDDNVIGLVAPAYDYQQMLIHDMGTCTSLAWINPLPSE
ncbi:MAG: hypothetical protein IPM53_11985 [Anaerolineaceae bacterium]|nr:hypothetical protein [Anaerolineaceae bacterium]